MEPFDSEGFTAGVRDAGRVLVGMPEGTARLSMVEAIETGGFVVCAELDDATSAIDVAREQHPDLALLYAEVPGVGIVAARDLLGSGERVAVVLLDDGDDRDDERLFAALEAGVSGVLPADTDPEQIPRILRGVLAGEAALPRATMSRVLREFSARSMRAATDRDEPHLSPRQQEVLTLLSQGLTTSEIAAELYISRVTVRTHVLAILRRLKLPDRAAAVEYFGGR